MKRKTVKEIQEWLQTYGFGGGTLVAFLAVLIIIYRLLFSISQPVDLKTFPTPEQQQRVAEIVKEGDISQCERAKGVLINGTNYEAVCKNNIALRLAFEKLDPTQCEQLDNDLMKIDDCKRDVLTKKSQDANNISLCDGVNGVAKTDCQDSYWVKQATQQKQVRLCSNISSEQGKDFCTNNFWIAMLQDDPLNTKCDGFVRGLREDCKALQSIVRAKKADMAQCTLLIDEAMQGLCRDIVLEKISKQ